MNRTFKGFAAAAIVLGTAAPMAFAATSSSWNSKVAGQLPIVVNGQVLSNPYELTAQDSGNTTAYFPVYYFNQALEKIGYTAKWDGTTHTWAITAPGVDASKISIAGGMGTGNTTITVNGTAIKMINTGAAKDPAGGSGKTTYFPAFYINEIFNSLGAKVSFSGQTGLSITGGAVSATSAAKLSTPTITGTTVGTGSQVAPAINESGNTATVATTLTDANGNPIANASLSLTLTGGSGIPTVKQGDSYVTVNSTSSPYTASVTTDANGTATFTVGGLGSYALEIDAPYTNNGSAVSQTVYVGFVNGVAILTPSGSYSANISTGSASTGGLVPVTVTLPEINSAPAADQQVTFTLGKAAGDLTNSTSAFFSNSAGGNISSNYVTTYTDKNGQATVWVNDYNAESVFVNMYNGSLPTLAAGQTTVTPVASTELDYSNPATPGASSIASIGVSAFGTSPTPTGTSVSGLTANSTAYFVPLDSNSAELDGTSTTYTISADNGAEIGKIDGVSLPAVVGTPNTVQLTINAPATGSKAYTATVDGAPFDISKTTMVDSPDFSVWLTNVGSKGSNLTVTSGNAKATAAFTAANTALYTSTFNPTDVNLSNYSGQSANVSFEVLDASGNPVPNASAQVQFDNSSSNVWVTAVNGTALTQNSEPSPVPLFNVSGLGTAPSYDAGFSIPTVASWNGTSQKSNQLTVFTDSHGMVTLTLQSGNVNYWTGGTTTANSGAQSNAAGATKAFTYGSSNDGTNAEVYFGQSWSAGYQVGNVQW